MARFEQQHGYQPHPDEHLVEMEAAAVAEMQPVEVHGTVSVRGSAKVIEKAADYGAYFTIVLAGTEAAQQILPFDVNRRVAYVTCTGTGPVWVGSEAQAKAAIKMGFSLATGITLPVTHQQPLWLVGDGSHAATVSIAIERWEPA